MRGRRAGKKGGRVGKRGGKEQLYAGEGRMSRTDDYM